MDAARALVAGAISYASGVPDKVVEKGIEKAVEWFFSKVGNGFVQVVNCDKEIQKLRRTLVRIHCLLEDAEERREIEDGTVKNWLRELKNTAFDAEDVLDRYDTLSKLKITDASAGSSGSELVPVDQRAGDESSDRKRKRKVDSAVADVHSYDFSSEIEAITERLDEIAKNRKELRLLDSDGQRRISQRPIAIHPSVSAYQDEYIGRNEEKQKLIDLLMSEHGEGGHVPVVPVCGVPGIGKTVVAKLAFNDIQLQNYFDRRIWVFVPEGSSVESITKKIVEAVTRRRQEVVSLNLLQNKLTGLLTGCKFLLVLDNLCLEENFYWETLQLPLLAGAPGSKVLVTTRSKVVCRGMMASEPIDLAGLRKDDGLELLRQCVFPNMSWDDYPQELEEIGKQIVERCQGSPLVVKSLGVILRNDTDESEWNSLLGQMGPLRDNRGDLLTSLMISYRSLDYQLKKCFAYCSVLPGGYEFCKDDLVRMWIAEGLVQPSGTRRLEAIGGKYFDELFWRFFFENCGRDQEKYRMPGLMHDLARVVSKHETLLYVNDSVLGDGSNDSKLGYRYGCLVHQKKEPLDLNKISSFQRLRMIFTHSGGSRLHLDNLSSAIFDELKFLRVLNLGSTSLQELPKSIGNLIQLRYLGLSNTDIEVLPEEVCNLYNLQTINLSECDKLVQLPEGTSKLVNLRHIAVDLQWDKIIDLQSMPNGIGNIQSLETLPRFTVTKDKAGSSNVDELNKLQLRGELCISKIEHLSIADEAKLQEKKYIDKLMLKWTKYVSKSSTGWRTYSVEVANKLTPQNRLKTLWLKDYPGSTFPSWLGNGSLKMLEELRLNGCINCEAFPQLEMLPRLKKLHAQKLDSLITLKTAGSPHFPALQVFAISDMPKLERWFEGEAGTFPKLQSLEIIDCPLLRMNCFDLKELNHFPSELAIDIQSSQHVVLNGTDMMAVD